MLVTDPLGLYDNYQESDFGDYGDLSVGQSSYASVVTQYSGDNGYGDNVADSGSDETLYDDPLGLYGDYEDNYANTFVNTRQGDLGASN